MTLTFGSLFAGIGGIDLGLERAGMTCTWQVEIDDYATKVLAKHWPDVPKFRDVRNVGVHNLPAVDLICGGFPCQDISNAGKRAGITGERSGLWSEFARIVRELRPRYVLVENVAALLGRGVSTVLGDLSTLGYDAEWECLPAAAVGAPHRRDRLFIVAYAGIGRRQINELCAGWAQPGCGGTAVADASGCGMESERLPAEERQILVDADGRRMALADADRTEWRAQPEGRHVFNRHDTGRQKASSGLSAFRQDAGQNQWAIEPDVGRMAHGVPRGLDGFNLESIISEIEQHATTTSSDPSEVLRLLWQTNGAPTFQKRGTRIPDNVSEAEILQLVLCKLQSIAIEEHMPQASEETSGRDVRSLWLHKAFTGTSHRSGLHEQRSIEYTDALQGLSRLLAQSSYTAWLEYRRSYATNCIDRLRGLGNAVVPQVAEFIGRLIMEHAHA